MPWVWISIGSNQDRVNSIRGALGALEEAYGVLRSSSVYESPAVGFTGDPFYNLVVGFDTLDTHEEVRQNLRQLESRLGRTRQSEKFSSRTIDLDLLTYGDLVIQGADYQLPHSDLQKYAFVMGPLAEIAPDEVLPGQCKSYAELWSEFSEADHATLKKIELT